ncbi:hypothetical protein SAMN05216559_1929 [Halomicrobium zhouii]|uniref:Uncharacterized protein n=1 Tax=Halomicrobium zhouii TaxID=767519 RepID=A0A1I6L340_9EURY|nr:hypothetical protein [Halomicrobium zhouii]SFR97864.1 hypothetical protein SAMN05216559_1929 [Halomicrobium zhouii]
MRRRALLATVGASLGAGCSALVPGDAERSTETVTSVPVNHTATDESTTPGEERDVPPTDARQVVELETGPRTLAVVGNAPEDGPVDRYGPDDGGLRVGFTETATADGPAVLEATLLNNADWENTFQLWKFPPFGDLSHTRLRRRGMARRFEGTVPNDVETGLYLAPTANHDLVDEVVEPRRGPEGYWQTPDVPPELPTTVTLEPGEYVTGEYHVLGHWDRAGFPTGTYAFGSHESGLVLSAWDATAPGPTEDARISASLPSLSDQFEIPWFHEADASALVYLEPTRERVAAPGRLSFRLVNRTRGQIGGNPYQWGLYKLTDGSWHRIAPREIPMPYTSVSPGDAYGYTLALFHGDGFEVDDQDADLARSVGRLGGGRYAFIGGFHQSDRRPPAAAFDLDAPTVPLSVADAATQTEDGGDALVTFPSWGDDDHPPDATLTVRRSGDDADETLIREVIARDRLVALETALAAIGDRERVVVRADDHAVENVTGYDSTRRVFDFEGTTYAAEANLDP